MQRQRLSTGQHTARSLSSVPRPCIRSSSSISSSRVQHVCFAGKLDEVSLFADSSMLGPGSASTSAAAKAAAGNIDEVELKSKVC